jgi:release factor glutamine methyltransferase
VGYKQWRANIPLNIRTALQKGTSSLSDAGIDTARLDAEVLLAHTLQIDRYQLYIQNNMQTLIPEEVAHYFELIEKRSLRIPIAYITEKKEFYSLEFTVQPGVLIPRPETENLVEMAINEIKNHRSSIPLSIIDIGTGSCAIACSIAKETGLNIIATDISKQALNIAQTNIKALNLEKQISLLCASTLSCFDSSSFDIIIANPPYIDMNDAYNLQPEVLKEPKNALFAENKGLAIIDLILSQGISVLKPGGCLLIEHGASQGNEIKNRSLNSYSYSECKIHKDYSGLDRIAYIRKSL